jgi:ATP-dependent DNA helicase PIF1
MASCNVEGVTLHSFAGIGCGSDSLEIMIKRVWKNPHALHRWRTIKTLVIDESSDKSSSTLLCSTQLFTS